MGTRSTWLNSGISFALGILLFFPFFFYPIATLIGLVAPDAVGLYKQTLAGGAAVLTVIFLLLRLLVERHGFSQRLSWSVVAWAPETWGFAFLGWFVVLTTPQREPTSVQNLIVYIVFFSGILLAQFVQDSLVKSLHIFVWVFVGILIVLGFIQIFTDLFATEISGLLGGPRVFGMYCLLAVIGLFTTSTPCWLRLVLGLALFSGAVASESRAAFGAIAVTLLVGLVMADRRPLRAFLIVTPIISVAFILAINVPRIVQRMEIPSSSGFFVNDSGRLRLWRETVASLSTNLVSGEGAGSSQSLARQPTFSLEHPHSEYLRILHDAGLIGFLLFAAFVVLALLWMWPRANGRPRGELVVAGFLVVVAGLVLGTIENYLVFPALMWPSAVFLGLGLAAARRDGQSVLDPRRKVRAASSEKTVLPHT